MAMMASRYIAGLACLLLPMLSASAAEAPPIQAGMRLREALRALEARGLRIFYSNGVVRYRLRVAAAPSATDPEAILAEILVPNGLDLEPGPNDSWLIVRGRTASGSPAPAVAAPAVAAEGRAAPKIHEVVVAASRYQLVRDVSTSRTLLDQSNLERIPSLGDDPIRVTSRLPGMATNGVSSRSNVRGGEVGEMLVRIDGLKLYDPFHLKDFQSLFSMLDQRVVGSIDVYTGGFPAAYGNRMSGVLDIESMSPPADLYHEIGMSFFNSSVLSSGRFNDRRGEWVVSARRSNLDVLYRAFSDVPQRPRYRDTFAKLSYELSSRLRVAGLVFEANDDITLQDDIDGEETAHANYDDRYYWLRLDHTPREGLSGVTLLSHSTLGSLRQGTSEKAGISSGELSDQRDFSIDSLQSDWSWTLNDRLLLQLGGSMDRVRGRYAYADDVTFDLLFDFDGAPTQPSRMRDLALAPTGHALDTYANLRFSPGVRLTADFGLRWDSQRIDTLDADTLSPRFGLRYGLSERTELRVGVGRYSQAQYINELQASDGVLEFAPPQRSDHVVLGVRHSFADAATSVRIEGYEKRMLRLRPRYENLLNTRILLPELRPDRIRVAPSSALARGFEILLERAPDAGASWWLGYSNAWVKDRIDGVDVFRNWDQTHAVSAGSSWTPGEWEVDVALLYRSGWPTSRVGLSDGDGLPVATVSSRNEQRLGGFGSLDVRVARTLTFEHTELTLWLELINTTDRTNPCCVEYEIGDEEQVGELLLKTLTYPPRVPSVGFIWKL